MRNITGALHAAVAAVAPIVGVSIGVVTDRATWRIEYTDDATAEQIAEGDAVLAAFDPATVPDDRRIQTRDVVARFTDDEWQALKQLCSADATLDRKFDQWLAGPTTNVNAPEFITLANQVAPVLWPDAAVRASRVAALLA